LKKERKKERKIERERHITEREKEVVMGERKEKEKCRNICTIENGKNRENTGKGGERKAAILNMM
jgi:hypothetical protein